jgi:hypothetical protein
MLGLSSSLFQLRKTKGERSGEKERKREREKRTRSFKIVGHFD